MNRERAVESIVEEETRATIAFGLMVSPHEGLAIIQEEFEELKTEVYKQFDVRSMDAMRKEAKQVAAMALRFMVDLT